MENKKAILITFEGLEGSGKSTQIELFYKFLKRNKFRVKVLREPGSTLIGERIREILLDKKSQKMSETTEFLLYLAARTQLIEEKLDKALKTEDVVICDRFTDSTIVYQGYGLGLDLNMVKKMVRYFSFSIVADLTFFLDVPVRTALGRLGSKDRIESRPLSFHQKLRRGYLQMVKQNKKRIKLVSYLDKQKASIFIRSEFLKICKVTKSSDSLRK